MSKENINLPKTAFSMKANLQNKEPGMVDYWDKIELYIKSIIDRLACRPWYNTASHRSIHTPAVFLVTASETPLFTQFIIYIIGDRPVKSDILVISISKM